MLLRNMMAGGSGGSSITYLSDLAVLPRAVWSLKKLYPTATLAIRVRRSSDNAEQNIGFSGNALDTGALAAFVGSSSAFVTKLYDQSGGGYDAVQASTASQARIVNAGLYDGFLVFDGINDYYKATAVPFGGAQVGIYTRMVTPSSGTQVMLESSTNVSSSVGAFLLYVDLDGLPFGFNAATGVSGSQRLNNFSPTLGGPTPRQYTTIFDKSLTGTPEIALWLDGVSQAPSGFNTVEQTGTFSTQDVYIGSRAGPSLSASMKLDTLILYADDTASLRASIETLF